MSSAALRKRNEKFAANIEKRGKVPTTTQKKGGDLAVGPLVLGFFLFVVVGSALLQIIKTATSGGDGVF